MTYKPKAGVAARTRDGKRVTRIAFHGDNYGSHYYPFIGSMNGDSSALFHWSEDGRYSGGGGIDHHWDLVADWSSVAEGAPSGPVIYPYRHVAEIVPGTYGPLLVNQFDRHDDHVWVKFLIEIDQELQELGARLNASELIAAGETLIEIGKAMEGKND